MTHDPKNDDPFVERISKPMRAAEHVDATFEARAMSAVHAAARAGAHAAANRSWWTRPRTVRLTPIASLALAASVAALAVLGTRLVDSANGASPVSAATNRAPDTIHVVRFVLVDSNARSVALAGNFNQWKTDATPLRAAGSAGVWMADVSLPPGRHEYAFVVTDGRGQRWIADPLSRKVEDDFGIVSSVIFLGNRAS